MVNVNSWPCSVIVERLRQYLWRRGFFVLHFSSESRTLVNGFDLRKGVP